MVFHGFGWGGVGGVPLAVVSDASEVVGDGLLEVEDSVLGVVFFSGGGSGVAAGSVMG